MQPTGQPSRQPSSQPSGQPNTQPTAQPTNQPSRQPSAQPSVHPSAQPSSQPSTQPSLQPSTQPTAQPSAQPSYQPSTQPLARPSSKPTAPPSNQPSDQPSQLPSTQPTLQPTMQPTKQPSRQPTSQPSMQPSSQPSLQSSLQPSSSPTAEPSTQSPLMPQIMQPSVKPSVQPSEQPSLQLSSQPSHQIGVEFPSSPSTVQPSGQPTSRPSSQPSSVPTSQPTALPTLEPTLSTKQGIWVTQIEALRVFNHIALVKNNIWACGAKNTSESCTVLHMNTGTILAQYTLVGKEFTGLVQGVESNRVILGSRSTAVAGTVNSDLANCEMQPTQLVCTVKTFYDTFATVVTFVPFPRKYLLFSAVNDATSMAIVDYTTGAGNSYLYSSATTKSLTISHARSPPNYVGAFVAGTAVSSAGLNYIVVGMVRADSGSMVAMVVVPLSGSIVNRAELVNTMALEYEQPDSFIAGGLHLSDGEGIHAYLLRVNVLFGAFKYGIRYRAVSASGGVEVGLRRTLSDTTLSTSSVTKGMVRVNLELYMIVDTNVTQSNNKKSTGLTVLRVDAGTGLITQQVHLASPNASLSCTDITASADGTFLYIACQVTRSPSAIESVVISTNKNLAFTKPPYGFSPSHEVTVTAESVPFKKVALTVSARVTQSLIVDSQYTTNEGSSASPLPSATPTVLSSVQDSKPPSSAPSGQPSSSPTSAPSVSPQPTSQPSSSGPTNTYKPTVKPTQRPSVPPSSEPTHLPTVKPTIAPTTRPSVKPSPGPSPQPSFDPSVRPTRAPSRRPTSRPSASRSSAPSRVPSLAPSANNTTVEEKDVSKRKDSDLALVIGGSVAGGLLVLFLSRWFLQVCVYLHKQHKKRKARKEIVQASIHATDPEQQRMVEEALRQRCEDAVSRGPKRSATRNVAPDSREDDRQVEKSMRSPPRSAGAFASGPPAEISADDDYQYIAADAFAQGAYINGTSQEEVKPTNEYVTPARPADSSSNDSSSLIISSLHSSERSNGSYTYPSDHHYLHSPSTVHSQESAEDSHSEITENSGYIEMSDESAANDNDW